MPQPHGFSQAPFDAIALHGVADSAADGETEATEGKFVRQYAEDQQTILIALPTTPDLLEPLVVAYSVASLHSAEAAGCTPDLVLDRLAWGQLDGDGGAAPQATPFERPAPARGSHALTESMCLEALAHLRLPRSLWHEVSPCVLLPVRLSYRAVCADNVLRAFGSFRLDPVV